MNDSQQIDIAKLTLLDDPNTPASFVIGLLEEVFGMSNFNAKIIAATVDRYGEAECGTWPGALADALLEAAQTRIDSAGHALVFARTSVDGRDVAGQEICGFCGKPASQVKLLYSGAAGLICDGCILRGANHLSENVAGTSFSHAHEVLNWHFGSVGQDQIETSVRSFPKRMRADL